MATVKWAAALTNRGDVLTTQLNTLTNNSFCAAGSAYNNASTLDEWFWFEFIGGGSITPTAGANLEVYAVHSPDASNYDDAPSANNVGFHTLLATIAIQTNAHTVRAISLQPVQIPPSNVKFVLKNNTGASLTASGNILRLWSGNESVA